MRKAILNVLRMAFVSILTAINACTGTYRVIHFCKELLKKNETSLLLLLKIPCAPTFNETQINNKNKIIFITWFHD